MSSFIVWNLPTNQVGTSDRLRINSIGLNEIVYRGYSSSLLEKGLLLDPDTVNENNLVIYGHRFSSRNPLKKYLRDLDSVKVGEKIELILENRRYEYRVSEILIVGSNDLWALSGTKSHTLTIVTCTPILNPIMRLIVIANLVSIY